MAPRQSPPPRTRGEPTTDKNPLPIKSAFAGVTGETVPEAAVLSGFEDGDGNLAPVSADNPLPVAIGGDGGSVIIAYDDGMGAAVPVSEANPLPIAAELEIGNLTVGAVEIKDGGGSNLVAVDASGRMAVDGSGVTQPVSAASLPLPTGASTSANQATVISELGNQTASLLAIESILDDALPTALGAGGGLKVDGSGTPLPVSGTVSLGAGSAAIGNITNVGTVTTVTTVTAVTAISNALPAGTNILGRVGIDQTTPGTTNKVSIGTDGVIANITNGNLTSVGTVGAVTDITDGNLSSVAVVGEILDGNLTSIGSITDPVTVTGALTDAELRATPVPVSGTVAVTGALTDAQLRATPVPVSGTVTITDGSGAITVDGTVNAAQSGTWNITNVSGTVSLPTGASTAAKQPALGTAGTASADVITVQGIAAMTPLLATVTGNITTVGAVTDITNNVKVVGPTAADSAVSAAPVTTGGRAATTLPGAVSDGDVVNAMYDKNGRAVVVGAVRENRFKQATTITNSTTETTIVSAAASVFHDLYGLIIANRGATDVTVTIRDDTAGGTPFNIHVPAKDSRGFMLPVGSAVPAGATNDNWTAQLSINTVTVDFTAFYTKNN